MSRRGGGDAAELVFRTFRRQHLEKFLPGLVKLGLEPLPHAVACAQYHYLSNHLGGVRVEYMYESDRKAWVRYVPPRWIYEEDGHLRRAERGLARHAAGLACIGGRSAEYSAELLRRMGEAQDDRIE